MPFEECTVMQSRTEFVLLASQPDANVSALARRFGISRTTAYTWLTRYQAMGRAGLADQSRRPHSSPQRTSPDRETIVLAVQQRYPRWGPRKLYRRLQLEGVADPPAPSTIARILRRHGIAPLQPAPVPASGRFEAPAPNALWQLDCLGPVPLRAGRASLLTIEDDHSRFVLTLAALPDQQLATIQPQLAATFARYGLPERCLFDNGPPWGTTGKPGWTTIELWLLRLGVQVSHGRPYHPQTQGKVERWQRTLKFELLGWQTFADLAALQQACTTFREQYNLERPHEGLGFALPVSRYQPSTRPLPAELPAIVYAPDVQVRRVKPHGVIEFGGRRWFVSRALGGEAVGVRRTHEPSRYTVWYGPLRLGELDLDSEQMHRNQVYTMSQNAC
jgi:transposase InsO family protein